MNVRTKIKIDRIAGGLLAGAVNVLARAAGVLLHRDHSLPPRYRKIVVCKLLGMGSIIHATPLLRTLKRNYPAAELIFVSTVNNRQLLERVGSIDTRIYIDDTNIAALLTSSLRALVRLWKLRIDMYFDLEIYSNFSSILTVASMARYRCGYFNRSFGYSRGIYTHMVYFNIKAPIANVYLQLAKTAGCTAMCQGMEKIAASEHERTSLAKIFASANIPAQKYIVINPNASDLRTERRWDAHNFAALAEWIVSVFRDTCVVFTGSSSERAFVSFVHEMVRPDLRAMVINFAGQISLGELCALLEGAELFVTNDSGPLHIAAAMKKKAIALFGPCSPNQYGAIEGIIPVYKNVYCSPCIHEFDVPPCRGDNACMKAITVKEVCVLIDDLMNGISPEKEHDGKPIAYSHSETSHPLGIVARDNPKL